MFYSGVVGKHNFIAKKFLNEAAESCTIEGESPVVKRNFYNLFLLLEHYVYPE
jgi:hypothetical protein